MLMWLVIGILLTSNFNRSTGSASERKQKIIVKIFTLFCFSFVSFFLFFFLFFILFFLHFFKFLIYFIYFLNIFYLFSLLFFVYYNIFFHILSWAFMKSNLLNSVKIRWLWIECVYISDQ